MANAETTIMAGALEDNKGRRLLPETTAAQVIHTDGESSETKFKRQAGSANMSATLAASAAKTVVDLSAYITNRSKTSYRLEILASTADGESPVATVIAELIGDYAVFYRQGVSVAKEITVTYRLVSMPLA